MADSRNRAIAAATGKYLQFADSDDWLRSDATERMAEAAEQSGCELVVAGFYRVLERRIYAHRALFMSGKVTRERFVEGLMRAPANFYYGVLWNKLFRTDIVRLQKIACPDNLDWCEDTVFNLSYLAHAKHVMVLPEPVYFYTKQKGSLSSAGKVLPDMMNSRAEVFERYRKLYQTAKPHSRNTIAPLGYWSASPWTEDTLWTATAIRSSMPSGWKRNPSAGSGRWSAGGCCAAAACIRPAFFPGMEEE